MDPSGNATTSIDTAERFVAFINAHDVEGLVSVMTPGHRFIDSLGNIVEGRDQIRMGWRSYFEMVANYRIDVERRFVNGNDVLLVGTARGAYIHAGKAGGEPAWETPAAFRAAIQGDRVSEWQVFADNEPLRKLMRASGAHGFRLPDR